MRRAPRPIRDEQAYRRILGDFLARRMSAADFLPRFRHLWECEASEGVDSVLATSGASHQPSGLYGMLDSIDTLCETYARNLPEGRGYRVSEEQFRKEVQSLASARTRGFVANGDTP